MNDIREYIENEHGRFKLEVWETSKAPEPGFCKYCVYVWAAEIETWYALNPSNTYMTLDVALDMGRHYLKTWSEQWTDDLWERIYTL